MTTWKRKNMEAYKKLHTEDVWPTTHYDFSSYGLKPGLLKGIEGMGYLYPSPVQEKTFPLILKGTNLLVRSKNGTGKTASYMIPFIQRIDPSVKNAQCMVIVPTRELALQVGSVAMLLSKHMGLKVMSTIGGFSLREDILRIFEGVHIIVSTPGRALDLINLGFVGGGLSKKNPSYKHVLDLVNANVEMLKNVKMLAFDEVDKLLDDNMQPMVTEIVEKTYNNKKSVQIVMCSATFPENIEGFCRKYIRNFEEVNVMEELSLRGITNYYAYVIDDRNKMVCLLTLLSKLKYKQILIFCNSIPRVESVCKKIVDLGTSCFYIHSGISQSNRNVLFHGFREKHGSKDEKRCKILVCTDIFARGVDSLDVNVVINFDLPLTTETYLHRIGRSGRFGSYGIAINLVTEKDKADMFRFEKELGITMDPVPNTIEESLYNIK